MTSPIDSGLERATKGMVWLGGFVIGLSVGGVISLLLMNLFDTAEPFWWTFAVSIILLITMLLVSAWIVRRMNPRLASWIAPALWFSVGGIVLSAGYLSGSLIPVVVPDRPFDRIAWQRGCDDRTRLAMLKDLKTNQLHVGITTRAEIELLLGLQRAGQGIIYRLDGTTEMLPVPPSNNSFYYCLGPEARLVSIDSWELSLSFDDQGILSDVHESAY